MAAQITLGNTNDTKALGYMIKDLQGNCYADKEYIGKKIFKKFWEKERHLIT
jgi:hypothetical protein